MTPHAREEHTYPFVTPPPGPRARAGATEASAGDRFARPEVVDANVAEGALRELRTELLGGPGEDRERPEMDGDDLADAQQLDRDRGVSRAHREVPADG